MTPSIHKVMFNVSRLIISNEQENAWEEGLYILFGYIYLLSIHQFSQWTHFLLALTFTLAFALTFALAFFFSFVALFVVSNHAFFTGSLVERWWHYMIIITSTYNTCYKCQLYCIDIHLANLFNLAGLLFIRVVLQAFSSASRISLWRSFASSRMVVRIMAKLIRWVNLTTSSLKIIILTDHHNHVIIIPIITTLTIILHKIILLSMMRSLSPATLSRPPPPPLYSSPAPQSSSSRRSRTWGRPSDRVTGPFL